MLLQSPVCVVVDALTDVRVLTPSQVAMSMHHSHDFMGKLCPAVGDTLVSAQSKPSGLQSYCFCPFLLTYFFAVLTLIEDTGPGVHDTTVAACSHELYERVLGISPDDHHDSCTNNLHTALAALGLKLTDEREFYSTPAPINLWMSTPSLSGATDTDSLWGVPDPRQRPGDQVVWRCETDLVVVMSACPASDVSRVNGASGSHDVHCRVWDVI